MAQALSTTPSKHVISLVGYQGSGKTTIGKELAKRYLCQHFEMSAVVRAIHTGLSRDELPQTAEKTKTDPNWLSSVVYDLIMNESGRVVVLTGVREPQIHNYMLERKVDLHSFEILAKASLRYERLLEIGKVESADQFLKHELDEVGMGIRKVMRHSRYQVITSDDSDPIKLALAMKKRLIAKGVK